jgi:hypothetical protein
MSKLEHSLAAALALSLWTSASNGTGPLRCDGKLINPGVSAAYVLYQCGEPQLAYAATGPVRGAVPGGFTRQAGTYLSEIWVYERGLGRFPAELHFRDGVLRRIEYWPQRSERRESEHSDDQS